MVQNEAQTRLDQYIKEKIKEDTNFDPEGWLYRYRNKFLREEKRRILEEIAEDPSRKKEMQQTVNATLDSDISRLKNNIRSHRIFSPNTNPFCNNRFVLGGFMRVIADYIETKEVEKEMEITDESNYWVRLYRFLKNTMESPDNNINLNVHKVMYYIDQLSREEDPFVGELIEALGFQQDGE